MTDRDDHLAMLGQAVDQMGEVLDRLSPSDVGIATPCRSWDVQRLVDHVMNDMTQFTAAARAEQPDWGGTPESVPAAEWATRYRDAGRELLATWSAAEDLAGMSMQVPELTVHAWDLSRVTTPGLTLEPALAEASLELMRAMLTPEYRGSEEDGKFFGPEQPPLPDSGPYERLAAFAGRTVSPR